MGEKLSILMLLHMPWDRNLGAPKPQIELAEEFRRLGHKVEKYDFFDAFPSLRMKPSRLKELARVSFSARARAFVKANAHRFDIIDSHQGNLPFSKGELGFNGLLVVRSVGLYTFYREFAELEKKKWPSLNKGNPIVGWLRSWREEQEYSRCQPSLRACDLINLSNHDEFDYLKSEMGLGNKCVVLPFGLSVQQQKAFLGSRQSPAVRLSRKVVAFAGSWSPRKGSKDWAEIIRRVRAVMPEAHFLFLGTGFDEAHVLNDVGLPPCDWIKVIPRYENGELPHLLGGAAVGAFPSYIEGFGIAVLEKLASGLPTVAYDVPGPREMLGHLGKNFLLPTGDIERFSREIVRLLSLDPSGYADLSENCVTVARRFSWPEIAEKTLKIYSENLEQVKKNGAR